MSRVERKKEKKEQIKKKIFFIICSLAQLITFINSIFELMENLKNK